MTLLAAPSNDGAPFKLEQPEPVVEATPDSVQTMLDPVAPGRALEIGSQAKDLVADLATFNPNSPQFVAKIADINSLAAKEIVATGAGSSRLLDRSAATFKSKGGDASSKVIGTLSDLRATVQDLTPNTADLTKSEKILGFIPGGNKLRKYFQKYETADQKIKGIVKSLEAGQVELKRDWADLQTEKANLWEAMGSLNEYIVLAEAMKAELKDQIASLRNAGNNPAADAMESEMLKAVNQRHQQLLVQLTVAVQGYMSMNLTQKNSEELIKAVEEAKTTTIFALRVAMQTAAALDTQMKVLESVDAVREATGQAILATSALLKQNTVAIHQKAVEPAVAIAVLEQAFNDIHSTLDEIDTFNRNANEAIEGNISALTRQLEQAKPQLERAKALEAAK
ncbi:toxic anion resistance protein [Curtobacterium sp. MCSS17_016]|uniref:toxic anion resistance protein n=1 Tax=Curtobacterium sp. MCSS17_016 TaxID=2175644 RepID=UPI000DA71F13|nr:toxic anion resistance protein [Curtobacterium sp. MCSS17_016]WIE81117.1 toxic anion resistance protein [Curtobacterium sp. MCSS17_016]